MGIPSAKQMKVMQVKVSETAACLVIVVPGGADQEELWASTGV